MTIRSWKKPPLSLATGKIMTAHSYRSVALKHFDLKTAFTFLKNIEFLKEFILCELYLSIFIIFKMKKNSG